MGKTPKKAAPGGDERNLYVRRLKATTAPSRASESSLPERQRESDGLNRSKPTGIQKKTLTGSGKNFKSKLRAPAKVGLIQSTKQFKLPMKNPETKNTDMQPESEEAEVKLNVPIQNEKEENTNKAVEIIEELATDKECTDYVSDQLANELQTSTKTVQEVENKTVPQEKEEISLENTKTEAKEENDQEDIDIKLIYEIEQSPKKNRKEELEDAQSKNDSNREELPAAQDELKNGINEKEEIQSDVQTDNESYSVDIVESTTSEVSEMSESVTQSDTQKDKEKIDDTVNNDASFISYNSSIMLKNVQVRLNDCLRDNSKLYDINNKEDTPSQLSKDISFGKTLRNISGRQSIGRMRHVTLRERRISPNSSLFVNTSAMSIPQDEGTESKVLHYNSDLLSDSFCTNGSSFNRKRKFDTSDWNSSKKQKTDEEIGLLNASLGLLKGLRSMQVSTPKNTAYKFESTKLDISGIKNDDNKITVDPTESTKKWCVIM